MISAVAVLCTRNESSHIARCLRSLIDEFVDVILIDNDSTDGTRQIASQFLGKGLLSIERLPWRGYFSLSEQLESKARIFKEVPHDWVIHIDADEWLCSPIAGQSLLDGIATAHAAGANCINFDEFVFVPSFDIDYYGNEYHTRMLGYYFFQPHYPRLIRAWRREAGLDNQKHGGHLVDGPDVRRYPRDFILRHYIALNHEQVQQKYLRRLFSQKELAEGWHSNRVIITKDNLIFPPSSSLEFLSCWASKAFLKSSVKIKHFWEW